MLKTVNDVPVPKNSRKNVCLVFSEMHVSKTNRVNRFLMVYYWRTTSLLVFVHYHVLSSINKVFFFFFLI